jgi:hypothetical protein
VDMDVMFYYGACVLLVSVSGGAQRSNPAIWLLHCTAIQK